MKYLLRLMGLRLGWTTQEDGSVYDPTKLQFPSEGFGSLFDPRFFENE